MSARNILAGKAAVEVSVLDKTAAGLAAAEAKLKAFSRSVGNIGAGLVAAGAGLTAISAAVLGPLGLSAKMFAEMGSELQDMSDRTGAAVEQLSALKYAAEQSGASLTDVEAALRNMARKGIDVSQFEEILKSIAAIEDPTERAARAIEVFGKSGTRLLPMAAQLDELTKRAARLGLVVSAADAAAADNLGDSFDSLFAVLKDLKFELGAAIAQPLQDLVDGLTEVLVVVNAFIGANRGAVVVIAGIAAVVGVAGVALTTLGGAFLGVSAGLAAVSAIIGALSGPIGVVVVAIAAIVAAITAAVAAFFLFTEVGQRIAAGFAEFMSGIVDAVANGDLRSAWEQVLKGIEVHWLAHIVVIKQAFWGLAQFVADVLAGMLRGVAGVLAEAEGLTGLNFGSGAVSNAAGVVSSGVAGMASGSIGATQAALDQAKADLAIERRLQSGRRDQAYNQMRAGMGSAADLAAGPSRGGAQGTFNAFGSALLGRAGESAVEREQKKQTGLLEQVKALLGNIDDNTEDLDTGFAFE